MSEPIGSITAAVLGVADFGPHLDFYCGELGYAVAAEGVVAAAYADRLWGEGAGDVEVRSLAAAGAATGRIHLLKVNDPVAPAVHPHTLDLGVAGINLYTRDIAASYERLRAAGHPWISPPQAYDVPVGERTVQVVEGYCLGPGGVPVVFVEPAGPRPTAAWLADPERRHTELTSVVCHVPDFEAELRFWAALGMSAGYDVTFAAPGLDTMADLPPGTRLRLAFLAGPDGGTTRIEMIRADRPRVDRRSAQRPARGLGHTAWSARTDDLDEAVARAAGAGGRVRCRPFAATTPLHGTSRLAMVETPNGVHVELWQPRHVSDR
ncbi:VOC family protein [Nonomuraea sp. NPDC050478]|uniref:VOC family protein n=1 Tax=Nonomuraea sp. NPDC050478 TaxID=3364365 RepID=UPI0037A6E267